MAKRVHFQVVTEDAQLGRRYYAACNEFISVGKSTGKRLALHPLLVTCAGCKERIRQARQAWEAK